MSSDSLSHGTVGFVVSGLQGWAVAWMADRRGREPTA